MMFFTFTQNNSGGRFRFDDKRGISVNVIVEADSKEQALERAESIGLYFNGVENGSDCECCGDRWSTYTGKGELFPTKGRKCLLVENAEWSGDYVKWMEDGKPETFIHFKDGSFIGTEI